VEKFEESKNEKDDKVILKEIVISLLNTSQKSLSTLIPPFIKHLTNKPDLTTH